MRTIQKNFEPNSLIEHRKQLHADYDNYADKDALRQSLVDEQRGFAATASHASVPISVA